MFSAMAWLIPRSSPDTPGIRPRGVDEGKDGPAELRRLVREPQRLAVSLGVRHAEVALQVVLHVLALLVAEERDGHAVAAARCPPTRAGSSPKVLSPCSSMKSSKIISAYCSVVGRSG